MNKKVKQESLFGDLEQFESWRNEWKDMPEFQMEDLTSEQKIIVHFESLEDRDAFAKLVDQQILSTTKSIWYPKLNQARFMNKRYIDEEE